MTTFPSESRVNVGSFCQVVSPLRQLTDTGYILHEASGSKWRLSGPVGTVVLHACFAVSDGVGKVKVDVSRYVGGFWVTLATLELLDDVLDAVARAGVQLDCLDGIDAEAVDNVGAG